MGIAVLILILRSRIAVAVYDAVSFFEKIRIRRFRKAMLELHRNARSKKEENAVARELMNSITCENLGEFTKEELICMYESVKADGLLFLTERDDYRRLYLDTNTLLETTQKEIANLKAFTDQSVGAILYNQGKACCLENDKISLESSLQVANAEIASTLKKQIEVERKSKAEANIRNRDQMISICTANSRAFTEYGAGYMAMNKCRLENTQLQ